VAYLAGTLWAISKANLLGMMVLCGHTLIVWAVMLSDGFEHVDNRINVAYFLLQVFLIGYLVVFSSYIMDKTDTKVKQK
jgi:hypothetical protein